MKFQVRRQGIVANGYQVTPFQRAVKFGDQILIDELACEVPTLKWAQTTADALNAMKNGVYYIEPVGAASVEPLPEEAQVRQSVDEKADTEESAYDHILGVLRACVLSPEQFVELLAHALGRVRRSGSK